PAGDFQTRIDEAPKPSLAGSLELAPLRAVLESGGLEAVLHLESSNQLDGDVFVGSDVALAFRTATPWNAANVRSALIAAVASYQSVGNTGLQWRTVNAGSNALSQWDGLFPLTIYVDGQNLWIAKSPALLGAALNHAANAPGQARPGTYLARYVHRSEL